MLAMKIMRFLFCFLFVLSFSTQAFANAAPERNAPTASVPMGSSQEQVKSHHAKAKTSDMQVVNINKADANELATLKGIGLKKAQTIIDYRAQHGDFKTVDELDNVKGISAKTIDKNRSRLTVS